MATSHPAVESQPYPRPGYAWLVVAILTLIYVFSFIDRQILNLLVGPIRRDLKISDLEMSYLMGLSFAIFYTLFGIPMGRIADTKSRRGLIAVGVFVWSFFTAGCGLARNFGQMLLMRIGVGVGEAALSPAAYSLIADYFPPHRRATAISVYGMGIYLGSGIAFLLGGLVTKLASNQENWEFAIVGSVRSWQVIFFAVGLPGILLTLLMLAVKEPLRRGTRKIMQTNGTMGTAKVPLGEVFAYINQNRLTFLCHNVGTALLSFSSYGSAAWIPTFFVRHHHWNAGTTGIYYGTIVAIFGPLGIAFGGWLADYLAERGRKDSNMFVEFLVAIAWAPTGIAYLLVDDPWIAMALLAPTSFLVAAPFGIAPAAIQQIMPNEMRGQASAIYLFVLNLIGLGIGPSAVAFFTDKVFHDDNMVGSSMLVVTLAAHTIAAVLLWFGRKHYLRSMDHLVVWRSTHQ